MLESESEAVEGLPASRVTFLEYQTPVLVCNQGLFVIDLASIFDLYLRS